MGGKATRVARVRNIRIVPFEPDFLNQGADGERACEGIERKKSGCMFLNGPNKVHVGLRAYNALMTNRQHDIVVWS